MKLLKRFLTLLIIALLVLTAAGCGSNSEKTGDTEKSTEKSTAREDSALKNYFVDAKWVQDNLKNVIVLDARKDTVYKDGHIPGAINAPWQNFADMRGKSGDKGWGTLLPKEMLAEKLGALGIDGKKEIVVYANPNDWGEDGRILWMLRMAGINNSKMLNGGWPAWLAAKGEVSREISTPAAVKLSIAALDESLNATTDYISSNKDKIKIVDARAKKEYDGATDFGEKIGSRLLIFNPQSLFVYLFFGETKFFCRFFCGRLYPHEFPASPAKPVRYCNLALGAYKQPACLSGFGCCLLWPCSRRLQPG